MVFEIKNITGKFVFQMKNQFLQTSTPSPDAHSQIYTGAADRKYGHYTGTLKATNARPFEIIKLVLDSIHNVNIQHLQAKIFTKSSLFLFGANRSSLTDIHWFHQVCHFIVVVNNVCKPC